MRAWCRGEWPHISAPELSQIRLGSSLPLATSSRDCLSSCRSVGHRQGFDRSRRKYLVSTVLMVSLRFDLENLAHVRSGSARPSLPSSARSESDRARAEKDAGANRRANLPAWAIEPGLPSRQSPARGAPATLSVKRVREWRFVHCARLPQRNADSREARWARRRLRRFRPRAAPAMP